MATIVSTQAMNLVEAQKRAGYKDSAAFLGELVKRNDLLQFAPWFESSDGAFHKWLQATRLGNGAFTKANGPVPIISSNSDTKIEPISFYQADSIVDDVILKTAKDKAKVRDSEDVANLQGFTNDWIYQLMYGVNDKEGFKGLVQRRANIDSKYTWNEGGTGSDLSSIWLFEFGERGFNFRYAEGTQPGISSKDYGRMRVPTPAADGFMHAWLRHYEIAAGMEIKNEKALLRLANIESGATTLTASNWIKMKNQLPNVGRDAMGFCNRTIHAVIESAAYEKGNMAFSIQDVEGFGPVTRYVGVPVMMMETILDTETALTA